MQCWDWIRVRCCEWQGLGKRIIPSETAKLLARLIRLEVGMDNLKREKSVDTEGGEVKGKDENENEKK